MPEPSAGSPASSPPAAVRRPGILINRDFGLLWFGQLISSVGDWAFSATVVLWIVTDLARDRPWAPLAVSGEFLALTVPVVLVGPLAGVFVDRWDRRRTMLAMDLARALLVALLVPLAAPAGAGLAPTWRLAAVYAAIGLASTGTQFFGPARLALIGDLVPPAQQPKAGGLVFLTLSVGVTVGPALATPVFFAFGPASALAFDALSFLVSYATLRAVRAPPAAAGGEGGRRDGVLGELIGGLRYFFGHRVLRTLLVVSALTLAGSSAINALGIFFLTDNLHSPPDLFGALSAATGAGVLVGSLAAVWIVPRIGMARSFWLNTIVVGGLILLYARQTDFLSAAAILVVLGLPSAGLNVAIGPLILASAPRELVGRAAATLTPATSLAATLAAALVGYLASTPLRGFRAIVFGMGVGPYDAIYLVAGALIAASGVYAMAMLAGRRAGPASERAEATPGRVAEALGDDRPRCP